MAKGRAKKPTSKKAKAEAALLTQEELEAKLAAKKKEQEDYRSLPKAERLAIVRKRSAEFGSIVAPVDTVELPYHTRRPFGIPGLDVGTGGGPSGGTLTVIWGKPGTCKNFVVNSLIKNVQTTFGEEAAILFGSCGYQYDKPWACRHGVAAPLTPTELAAEEYRRGGLSEEERAMYTRRVGALDLIVPNMAREGVSESPAETMLQGCVEHIRSGEYQLVIIDEGNVPSTREDLERTMSDEPKTAGLARLFTQFMGRMLNALSYPAPDGGPNRTSVVLILESRDVIGGSIPGLSRQSGGEAKNHIKVLDINTSAGEPVTRSKEVVGKQIKWRVTKGKMGVSEGAHGVLDFYFAKGNYPGGFDLVRDLAQQLVAARVIRVAGSWYYYPDDVRIAQGIDHVMDWLQEAPGRYEEMYEKLLVKTGSRGAT